MARRPGAMFVGVCALGLALVGTAQANSRVHIVQAGESLWTIARRYGCEVGRISEANRLDGVLIQPGQKLQLPRCEEAAAGAVPGERIVRERTAREHTVAPGETLFKLAGQYHTTVDDLRALNQLDADTIYAGQKIVVEPGARGASARRQAPPEVIGQSIGRPADGELVRPTRLPSDRAYHIRRSYRTYGTAQAVYHIRNVVREVKRRFPRVHKLAIGDLSERSGGKITLHSSHQSGRDVDLGFYFKKRPEGYPDDFVKGKRSTLYFDANWALLELLARTAEMPGGVERIYLTYETQKIFYELAQDRGIPQETLDAMFQYPNGRGATSGLVRHWPNHEDHFHVRFQCPADDDACE